MKVTVRNWSSNRRAFPLIYALSCILVFMTGPTVSEDGCPAGTFPSYEGVCKPPHERTDLPLTDDRAMRFESVQLSMMMIYHQAVGVITEDTPEAFEAFLASGDADYSKDIHIHSPGGNLLAALRLGEMIREAGFNTIVGRSIPLQGLMDVYQYPEAVCLSACAYAFLGGVTRSYSEEATFGVHRFGLPETELSGDDAQIISALLASYIERMGVDQAILEFAATASFASDMTRIPVDVAKQMRVIFDPSGLTTFRVEESGGEAIAVFDFVDREISITGMILCSASVPHLILVDGENRLPDQLRVMVEYPAQFTANGRQLDALATYVRSDGRTPAYVAFGIPGLEANSFAGDGFSLTGIDNPTLPAIPRSATGEPTIGTELLDSMDWVGAVMSYAFTIFADNGERTLPVVLRECAQQR